MDLQRKKLLEAIVFFVSHTKYCGAVKLFKLLYFLDMLHFRETGRSVTGLQYTALPYGPVPTKLYSELRQPRGDFAEAVVVSSPPADKSDTEPGATKFTLRTQSKHHFLSVREQRIATELAEIFSDASADQMSQISHAPKGPWERARDRNPGHWAEPISYMDAASPTLKMGSGKLLPRELLELRAAEFNEIYPGER